MALFVRKFTFATQFCDVLIVYFCIFYLNVVFLRFQALLFSLCPSLHCTHSFAAPSATKNSADGSSEPIRAVPLYCLIVYLFALTGPDITQSATTPAKKDMTQRIAGQKKKSGSEKPPFHNSGYAIEKILFQAITEQPLLPRSA